VERRFINAMQYLRYRDRVRWIKVTPEPRERSGWVWDHNPSPTTSGPPAPI
jgi:hypothetical protein